MKRVSLMVTALVLVVAILTLCGCETTITIDKTTEPIDQTTKVRVPETAVVEITSPEGVVLSTETVTMSKQDKEEEKNFFNSVTSNVSTQVSPDRLQQAIQNQQAVQNQQNQSDKH